jgi:hypothetical protein
MPGQIAIPFLGRKQIVEEHKSISRMIIFQLKVGL